LQLVDAPRQREHLPLEPADFLLELGDSQVVCACGEWQANEEREPGAEMLHAV
jgi:hypothetical protein